MHSDFLDKFKGKTNKIPKEGVANLIEATHKKPQKLVPFKLKETKLPYSSKEAQNKKKQSKISPSAKQNKHHHASYSANQPKRNFEKTIHKNKQILSVKQNKKPLDPHINVKKQPLKLPKINKDNPLHHVQSVRSTSKQFAKHHLKQNQDKNFVPEKSVSQLKRSMLIQVRQSTKPERSKLGIHGHESMLDDEALLQLKKLNDLELIVQQISFKRRQQMKLEELHNLRLNRKGLTVHY